MKVWHTCIDFRSKNVYNLCSDFHNLTMFGEQGSPDSVAISRSTGPVVPGIPTGQFADSSRGKHPGEVNSNKSYVRTSWYIVSRAKSKTLCVSEPSDDTYTWKYALNVILALLLCSEFLVPVREHGHAPGITNIWTQWRGTDADFITSVHNFIKMVTTLEGYVKTDKFWPIIMSEPNDYLLN